MSTGKIVSEFLRRGITACGLGPTVLAILYLILHKTVGIETLSVEQVCIGIFSTLILAFIAGSINAIYRIERLPLMAAITIHGVILYFGYLGTYLVNNWLEWNRVSIFVFTGIFVAGYLTIWVIIYSVIKKRTARINEILTKKREVHN